MNDFAIDWFIGLLNMPSFRSPADGINFEKPTMESSHLPSWDSFELNGFHLQRKTSHSFVYVYHTMQEIMASQNKNAIRPRLYGSGRNR
jgi:hypothetical protein